MKFEWLGVALAAGAFAFAGCGDDEESRRRAARGESTPAATRGGEKFPAGLDAGQDPGEGRDHDRRQVRRAAVRRQEPADGRRRGLRRRDGQGGRGEARRQAEVHRGDLRQPDPVPGGRHGGPDPLDDDDQRGARRSRSSSPTRTSSRAGACWCRATRTSRASADLAGKNVCTALGSTYEANLKKQAPEAKLKLVDSYSECLELVQNGAVDAVSTDDVILTGMIIQDDTLKLVGDQLTQEPYGAGIKKGDTEMVDVRQRGLPGPQGRRHVGQAPRGVDRQVHRGDGRAADDRRRRSRRARQEQLSSAVAARRPHRPLVRVQLGLLGDGAPRGDLVRDRHGRRHPRGGVADRADRSGCSGSAGSTSRSSATSRCSCCCSSPTPACGAPGWTSTRGSRASGRSACTRRPTSPRRCARASSRSARARSRRRCRSASPTRRRCGGSCCRRRSARSSRRSAR